MTGLFQISGLASGIDTGAMIDALIAIERKPVQRMEQRQTEITERRQAFRDVNTRLVTLKDKLFDLTLTSNINAKRASVVDTGVLTATAGAGAANGTMAVTVTQLATATKAQSATAVGQAIATGVTLENAGFQTDPESGIFAINGVQIAVDVTTDTLPGLVATINAALTAAGVDVTAALTNDADGRVNRLTLTPGVGTAVELGSGGDTSNILSVLKVLGASADGSGVVTSQGNLGAVLSSESLQDARLAVSLTTDANGDFTFQINGVEITANKSNTLNNLISRINGSGAGVTAAYDTITDKIVLTVGATGTATIDLVDITGNFLQTMNIADGSGEILATQTRGQNAIFSIDTINGGAALSSATNTISNIIPGVTLRLAEAGTTKVTVSQDTDRTVTAVQAFVAQFNSAAQLIREKTSYDSATQTAGVLFGDTTVRRVETSLRSLLTDRFLGVTDGDVYQSLADVGISSGRIGSAVGTTNDLEVDAAKLTGALETDPEAVARLFKVFTNTATLVDGGGSLVAATGTPAIVHKSGTYLLTTSGTTLTSVFTPTNGDPEEGVSATISAGGNNGSLILGMTLTLGNPLVDGTDQIDIVLQELGVAFRAFDFLSDTVAVGGLFDTRDSEADKQLADVADQIARLNERVEQRRLTLQRKFTDLELALSQIQGQQAALEQQLKTLNQTTSQR